MIRADKDDDILSDSPGYAIIYVLFITMLLMSFLGALVSLRYFYNNMSLKVLAKEKLNSACYSAVQIAISDTNNLGEGNFTIIHDSINVNINVEQAGLYMLVSASAKSHNDSSYYQCLLADKNNSLFKYAITVSHPGSNITVAGQTNIIGDILYHSAEIIKGNIFGIRNSFDNYHEGNIVKEDNIKTDIFNDSLVAQLYNYDGIRADSNCIELKSLVIDNEFLNTYSQGQNIIVNGELVIKANLNSKNYKYYNITARDKVQFYSNTGSNVKLIIKSDSSITINSGCKLENEILVSKSKIIVKDSRLKHTQLFSKDSLLISNSVLIYPSVVVNYTASKDSLNIAKILSVNNSIINGTLMLLYPLTGLPQNKSKILVDEKSKVQGIIYSENNVELSGQIYGSVYAFNFRYYKDPAEYINWLVNTHVDRCKLNKWFVLPIGFQGHRDYMILDEKWIY